ncbi:MAG: YetF domain-containing protein [Chloroflexota bacterium]
MFDASSPVWQFGIPPLELVVRSVVVYAIFLIALRVSGKRELGQFTIFDLAAVLLAANALQPAITGADASLPGALVILVTLFGANRLVAQARRRSAIARRLLDVPPTTIARDGAWIGPSLEREGLDDDDLSAALREHGLESIDEVELAVLEHDGAISVVPRQGQHVRIHARVRRYRTRGPGMR